MENYRNPAVREMAEQVRAHGRFGDTVLVHMNPQELGILAEAWPMTINPDTGQPEFFLQFLLPLVAGALGPTLGITSALGMAALTGGAGFLGGLADGQDPGQALIGGLTSGLTGGKSGAPSPANVPTQMFADELGMFPMQAAADAMAPAGAMATAGGVMTNPSTGGGGILGGLFDKLGGGGTGLMLGLLPALVGDAFSDKGPTEAPPDKWDLMAENEHVPDDESVRAPVQNYNYLGSPFGEQSAFTSGVDYAGIAPGYAMGGGVGQWARPSPEAMQRFMDIRNSNPDRSGPGRWAPDTRMQQALQMMPMWQRFTEYRNSRPQWNPRQPDVRTMPVGTPREGYGGGGLIVAQKNAKAKALRAQQKADGNTDYVPPTPRAPIAVTNPGTYFAGNSPYTAAPAPTPMAMPRPAMAAPMGTAPQFTGTNQIANLMAARRAAGYAQGGEVRDLPAWAYAHRTGDTAGGKAGKAGGTGNPLLNAIGAMLARKAQGRNGRDGDDGVSNTDYIPPSSRAPVPLTDVRSLYAGTAPEDAPVKTGYAMGGDVAMQPQMDDKAIVGAAIAALTGQSPNPQAALAMFVQRFGEDALKMLMAKLKGQQQAPQGGQGRYMRGPGDGLSDSIPATVDGQQPSALSSGEFVVPADAVSHLGNGSNESGAKELYKMIDRLRQERTGSPTPPPAINQQGIMPA